MNTRHRVFVAAAVLAAALAAFGPGQVSHADSRIDTTGVRLAVVDEGGVALQPATVMACPYMAGAPDCVDMVMAPTNRRGVARLRLDRDRRYEITAFVRDPDPAWACPGFELDGSEYYFATNPFTAKPRQMPRRATLTIERPAPTDCAPVTVTDETGAPLPTAGMFVCPLAADGTPCAGPSFDGPDPDGVIRLDLDPAVTYRLQAFIVNTGWPCPAFVAPNGDRFHFSASVDLPATQVVGTTFVIDRPEPADCAQPAGYVVTVTDENGVALATAGMFVCALAPDGTPCAGPSFDGPDPDGVIRLDLDPTVTYRLQAFIVNTGWPCPGFVAPNGDTFPLLAEPRHPRYPGLGHRVRHRPTRPHRLPMTTTRRIPFRPGLLLVALAAVAACASGDDEPADVAPVSPPTSPEPSPTAPATTTTTRPPPTTPPPTLASPPVDVDLAARIPDVVGYRTTSPAANSVLWPQFDLPDDVTVHAVNVEGDDDAVGSLVVVDGLDFDQHVNTLFDNEVELAIDAEAVAGDNMVMLTKPVQATWRNLGAAVIEAVRPDHDYGQWVWTHDGLTWLATGTLAMEAYARSLIAEQQRALPSEPWDYGALAGDIWDRLVVVPGYTYVDAPVLHALDGLPVTPFATCAKRFYVGFPREVDLVDMAPEDGDLQLTVADVGGLCRDGGFLDDLTSGMASAGMTPAELAGVPVTRSATEIFRIEGDRVLHFFAPNEATMARMGPFIERLLNGQAAVPVTDLTPLPVPTCLYREPASPGVADIDRATYPADCATPHHGELYFHGTVRRRRCGAVSGRHDR